MERTSFTPISGELQHKNTAVDNNARRTNDSIQDPDEAPQVHSKEGQETGVKFTLLPLVVLRGKYNGNGPAATLLAFDFDLTTPGALLSKGTVKLVFSGGAGIKVVGVAPRGNYMRKVSSTELGVLTDKGLEIGEELVKRPFPMPLDYSSLDGSVEESDHSPPLWDTARWDFDASNLGIQTIYLRGAILCKHSPRALLTATLTVDAMAGYTYNGEPVQRRFMTQTIFRIDEHRTHHEENFPDLLESMSTLCDENDRLAFQNNVNGLPWKNSGGTRT